MTDDELAELKQVYLDMLGFVPPKVEARLTEMAIHDPEAFTALCDKAKTANA